MELKHAIKNKQTKIFLVLKNIISITLLLTHKESGINDHLLILFNFNKQENLCKKSNLLEVNKEKVIRVMYVNIIIYAPSL